MPLRISIGTCPGVMCGLQTEGNKTETKRGENTSRPPVLATVNANAVDKNDRLSTDPAGLIITEMLATDSAQAPRLAVSTWGP